MSVVVEVEYEDVAERSLSELREEFPQNDKSLKRVRIDTEEGGK